MTKANSTCAFLTKIVALSCRKVKQIAYANYVRPIVEYASPVFNPHTKCSTNKIGMTQCRCTCYVSDNFDLTSSVTSLLNCLVRPTLEELQHHTHRAVMYRILHNQLDIHWQLFITKASSCTRGHSYRLFVPLSLIFFYPSSFFVALVNTGTTLPSIQLTHHPLTPLSGS